jgi:hypothetical protein
MANSKNSGWRDPASRDPFQPRVAFGDFDNDGDIDILVVNLNEPPSLCAMIFAANHWLKVWLIGVVSNRSAIGAQVIASYESRKQIQAVCSPSLPYLSVNDRRLHFD